MKRRSKAGSKLTKTRPRKTGTSNRRDEPKVARRAKSSVAVLEDKLKLQRELQEARDERAAVAEVLRIISASPGALEPVFKAILENAARICEAKFSSFFLAKADGYHVIALHNVPAAHAELRQRDPIVRHPDNPLARVGATKRRLEISDARADRAYQSDPQYRDFVSVSGVRTMLLIPMLKEKELVGVLSIYRQKVRPFGDRQIALLTDFAAQAVIAIENTRLLSELRQSLEQQTATSEVLSVISASPGELDQVFSSVLGNAARLCQASFGGLWLRTEDGFRNAVTHGARLDAHTERLKRNPVLVISEHPHAPLAEIAQTKSVVHIPDLTKYRGYAEHDPPVVGMVESAGVRAALLIPMLKDGVLIGTIAIWRKEIGAFTDKQIALVQNFAAQAVIAIENARLLNELHESLDQQTATSDVLRVISSSPGELEPVFEAVLENGIRLCQAKFGSLFLRTEEGFRNVVTHGAKAAHVEQWKREPVIVLSKSPDSPLAQVARTKAVVHINDLTATPAYRERRPAMVRLVEIAGARTMLSVPMLKENEAIGAIGIYRQEVRPFNEKQIELLTNFAAQAVIAIENARLLKELRERTEDVVKLNQQLEQRVADQVGEIERMGRLRRFLPPQVADLIVASGTEKQLESHRREITALFCDLRGFTGFSESSDPEDVMALLRDYHAAIGEIIIKCSGTLERYAGDGVMVVFNDPVPVENPALQAVLMALEMREAIGELAEKWRRLGHDIGFGIGIAHGFATLGTIGFEGRFDYAAIGTVSNVASRLCDEAKPGQILISPRVLMAVEAAVTVEQLGDFNLKGIRRPMSAYNVLGRLQSEKLN